MTRSRAVAQAVSRPIGAEIAACVLAAGAIYLALSQVSFTFHDESAYSVSFPRVALANSGGRLGALISGWTLYNVGVVAYIVPLPLIWAAYGMAVRGRLGHFWVRSSGCAMVFVALIVTAPRVQPAFTLEHTLVPSGGRVGTLLAQDLGLLLGRSGSAVFLTALAAVGWILWRQEGLVERARAVGERLMQLRIAPPVCFRFRFHEAWFRRRVMVQQSALVREPPVLREEPAILDSVANSLVPSPREVIETADRDLPVHESVARYDRPSPTIFKMNHSEEVITPERRREFEETAENLVKAFRDFAIQGKIVAIQPGPVVTVYDFEPIAGIKLSKMTGLMDDIALALKVDSIFIYPVSGKSAVGVQVPNTRRETVLFGDIVRSAAFADAKSPLTFAMGKSISGQIICADLATMPHILTAGQTGSGKSVFINGLLCSIIMKAAPNQVRFILVDPKILELKVYEGIPHLLMPVITEPMRASLALKWATMEMERRYKMMEFAKVRHIGGFNDYWDKASEATRAAVMQETGETAIQKLPYIVIVIDELADLMLTAPKDVEASIQRLAQKARASGIHLVLATQRPSVDVITGVIKANLPCRTAFKVFARVDSRTILDSIGAEKLLGKGDMLFLRPGSQRLERIQGAFLEDDEVVRLADAVRTTETQYDENAIAWIENEYATSGGAKEASEDLPGGDDPKWDDALAIAQRQGAISASYLQRSLKIGYNRAARLVEKMEALGLVERADGARPRKWLGTR